MTLPLIFFMLFILLCLGIFFLFNYRLFSLLEREDWPALAYYLEQKVFVKGQYSNRKVKLLASSYMVMSDYMSVMKLENKTSLKRPSIIDKNILVFCSARILAGKYIETAAFLKAYLDKGKLKPREKDWVRWFYGFCHLLNSNFQTAESEFISLAETSNDALIVGVSSYFLHNNLAKHSLNQEACLAASDKGCAGIKKALINGGGWKKEIDAMENEIHIAIIRKYIDEAGAWIFRGEEHSESLKEINEDLHSHDHVVEHKHVEELEDKEEEEKEKES
jgi:hypothetical protein